MICHWLRLRRATMDDKRDIEEMITDVLAVQYMAPEMVEWNDQVIDAIEAKLIAIAERKRDEVDALADVMQDGLDLHTQVKALVDVLRTASAVVQVLKEQRDSTARELDALTSDLRDGNFWDHPLLVNIYDRVMETHNAAFWESLPYDLANVLGDDWQAWDAGVLYEALTTDDDLFDDYEPGEVAAFRADLLTLVHKLQGREYAPEVHDD